MNPPVSYVQGYAWPGSRQWSVFFWDRCAGDSARGCGIGALRVAAGALTVGELSAFVMYMMLIVTPIALFAGS